MAGYEITIDGETHNQGEWCRRYDIDQTTVRDRMRRWGCSFEVALKTPKRKFFKMKAIDGRKAPESAKGYKVKPDRKCRRCFYSEKIESRARCMYIDIHPAHHRRGCEAGDNCIRFEPKERGRLTHAQKEMFT